MAITDTQRAEVLNLHDQGLARNEIARRVGISAGSVTNICRAADRTFDRSETSKATDARKIDLAAGRTRLAEKMLAVAEGMLDSVDQPYLVYNFGGKDNTYEEHLLDSAPFEVRQRALTGAGVTFDKLTRIVEKSDTGLERAVGVLDTIAEGFAAAAERYRESTTDEG